MVNGVWSRGAMLTEHEWKPVFREVIVRALCDALGFTNLPPHRDEHKKAVNIARAWFIEADEDFYLICDLAELEPDMVRNTSMALIHARSTGDHGQVPMFWKHVFKGRRVPNLTNIERAVAKVEKAA